MHVQKVEHTKHTLIVIRSFILPLFKHSTVQWCCSLLFSMLFYSFYSILFYLSLLLLLVSFIHFVTRRWIFLRFNTVINAPNGVKAISPIREGEYYMLHAMLIFCLLSLLPIVCCASAISGLCCCAPYSTPSIRTIFSIQLENREAIPNYLTSESALNLPLNPIVDRHTFLLPPLSFCRYFSAIFFCYFGKNIPRFRERAMENFFRSPCVAWHVWTCVMAK